MSNSTFWRSHRHYKAQSVVLSLSWTLMSFGVYWELMQGAKTRAAQARSKLYRLIHQYGPIYNI